MDMNVRPERIVTARLTLKAYEDVNQTSVIAMVKDPLVTKSYMIYDFPNQEAELKFFHRLKVLTEDPKRFVYGIFLGQEAIGFLNEVHIEDKEIELGYFIASKHWNQGYATEALSAVIPILFDMGYERIVAAHFEENPTSGRVMAKAGMHRIDREEELEYRGKMRHCLYYGIEKK